MTPKLKARRTKHLELHPELDDVNLRLLAELHADPRASMSALARRVGMSAPAVTDRVRRMERAGIISGFRMDVDPTALGLPVAAFVRIRPGPGTTTETDGDGRARAGGQ